jgi:amino acid transporter
MTLNVGWLCLAGWQAAICAMAFLVGTIIQALIILHYPDTYAYEAWHGTLLVIAIILASFVFNSVLATRLPLVEGVVLLIHVCGLFAIVIPLCVLSPRKSADAVFTEFSNVGGWSSTGVAFMVGLLPLSASVGGIDCMVHMGTSNAQRLLSFQNHADDSVPDSRRGEGCVSNAT